MVNPSTHWRRMRVKAGLGWRWWTLHRRWVRIRRLAVHWATLRPEAPRMGRSAVMLLGVVAGSLVLSLLGFSLCSVAGLGAVLMLVPVINRLRRRAYRGLIQDLCAQGPRWHEARHDARTRADLARWRWQAYPWRGPRPVSSPISLDQASTASAPEPPSAPDQGR